jgi:ankyrin repeat protein
MKGMRKLAAVVALIGINQPILHVQAGPKPKATSILTTARIAALALPSVVSITVRDKDGQVLKTGSGFVLPAGWGVATNQHVVMGAHEVTVNFADGRSVSSPGFIVESTRCDLAILSCDTRGEKGLSSSHEPIAIGDSVVAIGSPEGLNGSVTTGIVSAIRMLPAPTKSLVYQITAPISHGSSGGPVLDQRGQVIGMASFYVSGGENLNFAHASSDIDDTLNGWIKSENSAHSLPPAIAQAIVAHARANGWRGSIHWDVPITRWDDVPKLTIQNVWLSNEVEALIDAGADVNRIDGNGDTPLILASESPEPDCVKLLLATGADVNETAHMGETALTVAAQVGNLEIVKELLNAGADVNAKTNNGSTALITSAMSGHGEITKALIAAGADIEVKTNSGDSALCAAGRAGSRESIDALLASGASVKIDSGINSPLIAAILTNQSADLTDLLDQGSDVNAGDTTGATALMYASALGEPNLIDLLIAGKADVNRADNNGRTALMNATSNAHADCVQRLLAAGANVNAQANGTTALIEAASSGDLASVKLLLAAGANVNVKDGICGTALSSTISFGHVDCFNALVDAGATDGMGYDGATALMFAIKHGLLATAKHLIAVGSDVNAKSGLLTTLGYAVVAGNVVIVKELIAAGANVNATDDYGETVLMESFNGVLNPTKTANSGCLGSLLNAGANVNARGAFGYTALMLAASDGDLTSVKALIAAGADIDSKNDGGYTALYFARTGKNGKPFSDVVVELKAAGATE